MNDFFRKYRLRTFLIIVFAVSGVFPASGGICGESNAAISEKRVLEEDPGRDALLLRLSGNDALAKNIIDKHSLIVGSKLTINCPPELYDWMVDNVSVSASLSRLYGRKYKVTPGDVYEYHGVDGDDSVLEFFRAYQDSVSTVYIGRGTIRVFHIPVGGSFINHLEYFRDDDGGSIVQNCMYIMVNNRINRFFASILFALSDVEKRVLEIIFSMDDTTLKIIRTFMEDPHLVDMLKRPDLAVPDEASDIAVRMRETILTETSPMETRKLGVLIEKARNEHAR